LVSINYSHTGFPDGPSDLPMVSGDGRFVAYRSYAMNIVPGDSSPAPKIFLFDRLTQFNTVLSPSQNDSSPLPWISMPVLSASGGSAAFLSVGSSLVSGDFNRVTDAFAAGVDSDSDGLPDAWVLQYFGHAVG